MWLLHLLPDSFLLLIVHTLLVIGAVGIVLGFFFSKIPFVKSYQFIIQLVSIIIFCTGVYWYGGYSTEMIWREEARKLQEKIDIAEAKAPVITKEIVTKYKDKILIVKHGIEVVKKEIEIKREIINEGCKLNPTAVEMYNKGVTGPKEETK